MAGCRIARIHWKGGRKGTYQARYALWLRLGYRVNTHMSRDAHATRFWDNIWEISK